jgi:hypothetical protein
MRHLEYRIGAKTVGVVAVLVAGGDHQEAEPHDVGESVRDLVRCARILDAASETISDAQSIQLQTGILHKLNWEHRSQGRGSQPDAGSCRRVRGRVSLFAFEERLFGERPANGRGRVCAITGQDL